MKNVYFLLSKDCMSLEALPCYGGCKYWKGKTPNIDELYEKGTVFNRHYTAAPSTSMAMSAMLTGHYAYEFTSRKRYENVKVNEFRSIFDEFQENGYECHLLWDYRWMTMAWRFVREFGDDNKTILHNIPIGFSAGAIKPQRTERDDNLLKKTLDMIYQELSSIDLSKKQFIWLHLPHVLFGRRSYMDDMDVLDEIVGYARKMVGDDCIYFTTDHGHMNMHKGKFRYGFDVYEPAIHIPLITPRINGLKFVNHITSNIDLPTIILKNEIPQHDYVVSEIKYYMQPHRKIAITTERFKYIYNADGKIEELYDIDWDPLENYNILNEYPIDKDRKCKSVADELYFYPYRLQALEEYKKIRDYFYTVWKEPTRAEKLDMAYHESLSYIKNVIKKITNKFK